MDPATSENAATKIALDPGPPARVGIYRTDALGRCTFVSKPLCELFEISEEEALNLGWLHRIHPQDRRRVMNSREKAISPIPAFYLEYRIQLSTRTIWVSAFSTAIMDGQEFKGRSGIVREIIRGSKKR